MVQRPPMLCRPVTHQFDREPSHSTIPASFPWPLHSPLSAKVLLYHTRSTHGSRSLLPLGFVCPVASRPSLAGSCRTTMGRSMPAYLPTRVVLAQGFGQGCAVMRGRTFLRLGKFAEVFHHAILCPRRCCYIVGSLSSGRSRVDGGRWSRTRPHLAQDDGSVYYKSGPSRGGSLAEFWRSWPQGNAAHSVSLMKIARSRQDCRMTPDSTMHTYRTEITRHMVSSRVRGDRLRVTNPSSPEWFVGMHWHPAGTRPQGAELPSPVPARPHASLACGHYSLRRPRLAESSNKVIGVHSFGPGKRG